MARCRSSLTITFRVALAKAFGWTWQPALWFGALIALSSTMVALTRSGNLLKSGYSIWTVELALALKSSLAFS